MSNEVNFSYDENADVMYIYFGDKPNKAISEEHHDTGVFIRRDFVNNIVVGITIIDFSMTCLMPEHKRKE